jgi:bifunctional DNase/RNase
MVPVTIAGVVRSAEEGTARGERFSMQLAEIAGSRRLYIGVGDAEAAALAFSLHGTVFPRPMTYQFAAALLGAAGSGVRGVHVTSFTEGIFYARVVLLSGAAVDARPSDAVNLAAVTGAPVYVARELLDLPTGPRQPAV